MQPLNITPSDTNPNMCVVSITQNHIHLTAQDGSVKPLLMPEGSSMTLSVEIPYQELAEMLVKLHGEVLIDYLESKEK